MREILIVGKLRMLQKHTKYGMHQSGKYLPPGTTIQVGEVESVWFQNDEWRVLPFIWNGETYYIMESDLF